MRPTRVRRGLALLGVLGVLAPLPQVLGAAPTCPGEAKRTRADGWVELRAPGFAAGELDLIDYAVLPFTPNVMFATNGDTVERSMDGGCRWEQVYANGRHVGENIRLFSPPIVAVEVPPSVPGRLGSPVYLVRPEIGHTTIIKSNDLGTTWDDTTVGLPAFGQVRRLRVSANPRTAYLLAEPYNANGLVESNLYVTRDGGVTWTSTFKDPFGDLRFTDFALDPVDARIVWAWNEESVHLSEDGGATFAEVPDVPTPVGVVDVQRYPPYQPSRVMVFHGERAQARRSVDGGSSFRTVPTAGVVRSTANVYSRDVIATASSTAVRVEAPGLLPAPVDVTPKDLDLTDLAFGLGGQLELFGREGAQLYRRRFTPSLTPEKPRRLLPPVNLTGPVLADIKESELRPAVATVALRPGQTHTQRYTLDLARTPTPLDVMFATDSTGSMSDAIASLREDFQDIINDLARTGIDVWFGIGDFKDYPTSSPGDYPWKRRRAVGPIDPELKEAIESISTGGGTGLDSSLAASYQAATGAGQRAVPGVLDVPGDAGYFIAPGQGAEWRKDSAKVIVMAADVRSRDPETDPGYPGPSYATVIRALRRLDVKQVGLSVGRDSEDPEGARKTLERVAEGTQTLAPPGGTDCNDDREIDVAEGEPLVCSFNRETGGSTSIAPALVAMLQAIEDLQTVSFDLQGDARVFSPATAVELPDVNVKRPHRLSFAVTFRCDAATAGTVSDATIRARVGTRPVGKPATARVACAVPLPRPGRPEALSYPDPPPPQSVAIAVAPLPPPPPPAPVPQPQVNTNPNPNPQAQAQAQAQAGVAAEEQESPQLAFAQVEIDSEETELAIVGRDTAEEQAAQSLLWVSLAMAAATGVALERRSRPRGAPGYARESR